jgi:hypothetical protein
LYLAAALMLTDPASGLARSCLTAFPPTLVHSLFFLLSSAFFLYFTCTLRQRAADARQQQDTKNARVTAQLFG